jgi:predicted aspartyl protease
MNSVMKRFAVAAALLATLGVSDALADNAPPPAPVCTLLQVSSLPMRTDPDGRVSVPARVSGRAVHLLVDTGAIYSALDSTIVDELRLRRQSADGEILAGNIPITQMTATDRFELGSQHADNFRFMVMPSQALDLDDDGLLGANIMKFYDVEFDFAHSKFNLFSQKHCKNAVVYWTKTPFAAIPMQLDRAWHITVPVTINGKEVTAVFDSGAADSVMSLETAKRIFGLDEKSPLLKPLGNVSINGASQTQLYRYPFPPISFQGVTINNPEIDLVSQSAFFRGHGAPELLLGVGVLRQLRFYVAYGEQVLYVTPAEAH